MRTALIIVADGQATLCSRVFVFESLSRPRSRSRSRNPIAGKSIGEHENPSTSGSRTKAFNFLRRATGIIQDHLYTSFGVLYSSKRARISNLTLSIRTICGHPTTHRRRHVRLELPEVRKQHRNLPQSECPTLQSNGSRSSRLSSFMLGIHQTRQRSPEQCQSTKQPALHSMTLLMEHVCSASRSSATSILAS